MPDLFLDDADAAAIVLDHHGYPALAETVRDLIERVNTLTELLDEAHDGTVYLPVEAPGPVPPWDGTGTLGGHIRDHLHPTA